jgi:hypothetical protein
MVENENGVVEALEDPITISHPCIFYDFNKA